MSCKLLGFVFQGVEVEAKFKDNKNFNQRPRKWKILK